MNELLDKLYYKDHNYDSVKELYRKAKLVDSNITEKEVKAFLSKQATHQINTDKIGERSYLKIYSEDPDSYQIDLTFLPKYKNQNNQNYVMFTAININSRYAYESHGKDKQADTIIDMLNKFKKQAGKISSITCDSGSEFISKEAKKWFEKHDIKIFYVVDDSHILGIINRFHRTLKGKLIKYFSATDNYRWIEIIDTIIHNYNNTKNRGIGYTPTEVKNNDMIASSIIVNSRKHNDDMKNNYIQTVYVGDLCRVREKANPFKKMEAKWSDDIYTITKVSRNTVDLESDTHVINGVNQDKIIIVNGTENKVEPVNKKKIDKANKVARFLKREGISTDNIIK